jgi:hypothetical protein
MRGDTHTTSGLRLQGMVQGHGAPAGCAGGGAGVGSSWKACVCSRTTRVITAATNTKAKVEMMMRARVGSAKSCRSVRRGGWWREWRERGGMPSSKGRASAPTSCAATASAPRPMRPLRRNAELMRKNGVELGVGGACPCLYILCAPTPWTTRAGAAWG